MTFKAQTPTGAETDVILQGQGSKGALSEVSNSVPQELLSISANPIEALDFLPALKSLDVLTEDFDPIGFEFGGRPICCRV